MKRLRDATDKAIAFASFSLAALIPFLVLVFFAVAVAMITGAIK